MEKKSFLMFLKGGLMLFMLTMMLTACDKKEENDDEPNTNPKNIVGRWQKYEVAAEDNSFVPGDADEFWIFKSDGSFQNEDGGEITTVGIYEINGNILSIYSHSVDEPNELENFSGEFYFSHGFLYYDFVDLETGDKSIIRFKKI